MPPDEPADTVLTKLDVSSEDEHDQSISEKANRLLTELARLVGRQMAREQFAAQKCDKVSGPDIADKH